MGRLFEDLKKGLQEIIAYEEGKIALKSEFFDILSFQEKLAAEIRILRMNQRQNNQKKSARKKR